MQPQVDTSSVVTKGEFARRRNVSPGRVSQWIGEGRISGDALVGTGREQRINEAVACRQLDRRLDVGQRFGNGLHTRLDMPERPAGAIATGPASRPSPDGEGPGQHERRPDTDTVADRIQREKLQELERRNREGARQEAVAAGLLTDTAQVRQAVGRETAQLLSSFDGAIADMAAALAAALKVPQRDVLHLMRGELRKWRAARAEAAQRAADATASHVAFDVPDTEASATAQQDDGDDAA